MSVARSVKQALDLYKLCRASGIALMPTLSYILYKTLNTFFQVDIIESYVRSQRLILELRSFGEKKSITKTSAILPNKNDPALEVLAKSPAKKKSKKTFVWFVPNCSNVWGGGHYTIFRFANFFANEEGVRNVIYIYDYQEKYHRHIDALVTDLEKALPNCLIEIISDYESVPESDVAIATTWQSAYVVKAFDKAKKKFYFMQDYESLFYPAGTQALQANHTYSFGFAGITGGLWLKERFESYGGKAQEYIFSADRSIFYPPAEKKGDVKRLFFYGRPSTERRAFELGIAALEIISSRHPELEIVIAGLDNLHSPKFDCVLMGSISLKETGELYRRCDIGMALSATNLSYLPVELMASGCPVVTNDGPQVEWFCKNEVNALVTSPTAEDLANAVSRLIEDEKLRAKLIKGGLETIAKTTWEKEMQKIYKYIDAK